MDARCPAGEASVGGFCSVFCAYLYNNEYYRAYYTETYFAQSLVDVVTGKTPAGEFSDPGVACSVQQLYEVGQYNGYDTVCAVGATTYCCDPLAKRSTHAPRLPGTNKMADKMKKIRTAKRGKRSNKAHKAPVKRGKTRYPSKVAKRKNNNSNNIKNTGKKQ